VPWGDGLGAGGWEGWKGPYSGADGTTRPEGDADGNSSKTQPDHPGVAQLFSCGQLDQEVSGPGPLCEATCGAVDTSTPEGGYHPPRNSKHSSAPVDSNTSQHEECAVRDLESSREKVVGKPYEGEPHVRFDVAGAGNVAMVEL